MAVYIKKMAGVLPTNAIVVDSTSAGSNGATSSTTLTWSHTVGAGYDRMLVVFIPVSQAILPLTVKYGSTSLSQIIAMNNGVKAYIYELTDPTVGTANIEIVFDTNIQWLYAGAASFKNVKELQNGNSGYGTAQNRDFSLTASATSSYLLECMADGGSVNSPASGQTRITYENRISSYDTGIVSGTNTQSWTGTANMSYAWVGCELPCERTHFNSVAGIDGHLVKKVAGISNV